MFNRFRVSIIGARSCCLGLLLLLVTQTGCIKKRLTPYLRYDEASDRFVVLFVFTHYQASTQQEYDWLALKWAWRHELMPTLSLMDDQEVLRVSNNSYWIVGAASAVAVEAPTKDVHPARHVYGRNNKPAKKRAAVAAETPRSIKTEIPLASITITPGDYFVGPGETLCRTQRLDLPGTIVDQWLGEQFPAWSDFLRVRIDEERKRRTDGGKAASWESLRQAIREASTAESPANSSPDGPLCALADESLSRLEKAAAANTLQLRRHGATFSLLLPLTCEDTVEFRSTVGMGRDTAKAKLLDTLKLKQADARLPADMEKFLDSIVVEPEGEGCKISLTLPAEINSDFLGGVDHFADFDSQQAKVERGKTLAAVRAHKVPVREDVEIADLIAHFRAESYRKWTDKDGKSFEALFTSRTATTVSLRRQSDGKQFEVPLVKLSDEDRRYVESR